MALFCLGESDAGCVYLVGYNGFLAVSKKPYIITLIPALFMTCVCLLIYVLLLKDWGFRMQFPMALV